MKKAEVQRQEMTTEIHKVGEGSTLPHTCLVQSGTFFKGYGRKGIMVASGRELDGWVPGK